MDRVQQELRRPAVWLIPLVVLADPLVGSGGPRHRAGPAMYGAPLNWFGYLLLVAGPVVLLLRPLYPAFLTAAPVGSRRQRKAAMAREARCRSDGPRRRGCRSPASCTTCSSTACR